MRQIGVVHPALWLLFTVIWLPFLTYPIRDLLAAHFPPSRLTIALAGMALFVGIYLWLMLHDPFRDAPLSPRELTIHVLLIVILVAVVLSLTKWYSVDWLWFVMYANMATAVKLPMRIAAPMIVILTLLAVGVGRTVADREVVNRIASPIAAVAVVMIGISQLVVTIRKLRAARQEIARLAVAEERLRFARDVHDLLGHSLSTIAIKTALARRLLPGDPERAMHELDDVQTVTQEALREVREAVTGYRQPALATELANAREVLAAAGIACQCEDAAGPLPPPVESVVAWAVREGVTNVVRHSRARHVTIGLHNVDGSVQADIIDDGTARCTPTSSGGSGLRGLAERAAAIGGSVDVRPVPDGRIRVACLAAPPRARSAGDADRCHGGRAMIRILLAEDQAMIRGALAALLGMEGDMEVVAEVARGDEVVARALATRPDVALLDIEMPGCDGIAAAAALHEQLPACRVLMLTTFGRPGYLRRAMESKAVGFLVKDAPSSELAGAIRRAMAGERVIDAALAASALSAGPSPLSERERQLLRVAASGATIAEMARAVSLSEGTVRNYLSAAIQKLEARGSADAARIAEERGWLSNDAVAARY